MLDFTGGSPYTGPSFSPDAPRAARTGLYTPLIAVRKRLGLSQASRASEDTVMPTGTIARLLIDKGFGFIRDEGGIEHFFHRSAVRGAVFELLREGQRVEFTSEDSGKGPRAGDVRLIEG
jgi:CspA family cold shock protein